MRSFSKKEKTQRIAMAVLMGMNYVNALLPLGVEALSSTPAKEVSRMAAQSVDVMDELFFATAYAGESSPYESPDPIIDREVTVDKAGGFVPTTIKNTSVGSGGKVILTANSNGYPAALASNCTISDGGQITVTLPNMNALVTSDCRFYSTAVAVSGQAQSIEDTIDAGAVQTVQNNGFVSQTILQNGGIQNVGDLTLYKTGATEDVKIKDGGVQNIVYGKTSNTSVLDGGIQNISNGGSAINTIVSNGGVQNVQSNGIVYGGTVSGVQNLSAGAKILSTGTNTTITIDGGTQNIYGQININSKASIAFGASGGQQVIHSGGNYSFSTLTGGTQTIMSGGTGGATNGVKDGGTIEVQSGGTVTVYSISAGGTLTINDGAEVTLGYGGLAGGTINVNGGIHEYNKGYEMNKYGTQNINNGATGIRDYLTGKDQSNPDIQNVNNGIGSVTSIGEYGQQNIYQGTGTADKIHTGGTQTVVGGSGHVADLSGENNTVNPQQGGSQVVLGGIGSADIVKHGGVQIVNGGTGLIDKMEYAGTQIVDGGSGHINQVDASGASNHYKVQQIIKSGIGTIDVMTRTQSEQIIEGGSGYIGTLGQEDGDDKPHQIISGGMGSVDRLIRGGTQTVSTGAARGHANLISGYYDTGIYHGGIQTVSGGTGTADLIDGGQQIVGGAAAQAIANTITNLGLQQIDNGTGSVGTVSAQGEQLVNGGSGHVVLVGLDGKQTVNGGTATADIISGGLQDVKGGTATANALIDGGKQTVSAGAATATAIYSGGVQEIVAGTGTAEAIYNGGAQEIVGGTAADSYVEGGDQHVRTGTAGDTTINTGVQHIYNGGSTTDTTLNNGKIHIAEAGATVGDIAFQGGEIVLGGNAATYSITGTITDGSKGLIDMVHDVSGQSSATFETLNINAINSDRFSILMDVDTETLDADKVVIANASGTNTTGIIKVNNLGTVDMGADDKILLVTENSKTAKFVGAAYNTGGLFALTPIIENGATLGADDKDWYMVGLEKRTNNDTNVLLTTNDNNYAMWRNTNDSMRKHFGELRRNGELSSNGIWARTLQGKFEGDSFDSSYSMYQLGYDHSFNNHTVYGLAVEHGTGRANYLNGSGEDDLTTFSLYGIWYGKDGLYTNVTGRYGSLNSKVSTYGDYPDTVRNRSNVYSISVEHGKTIALKNNVYIEPQVQLTIGRLGSMNYTTERGHVMNVEGMNSIIGRAGLVLGQKSPDGNELYITTSILHEFAGRRNVSMYGGGDKFQEVNDYRGTWCELGLGTVLKLNKTSNFYAEFNKTFGGSIIQKWQINAGMRVGF